MIYFKNAINKRRGNLSKISSLDVDADNIIRKVGLFIDHMHSTEIKDLNFQDKGKSIFADIVLLMRRDLGFTKTDLTNDHYKFFSFN